MEQVGHLSGGGGGGGAMQRRPFHQEYGNLMREVPRPRATILHYNSRLENEWEENTQHTHMREFNKG